MISQAWVPTKALPKWASRSSVRELAIPETRILVAIDADHDPHAILVAAVYRGGQVVNLTLDVMRRRATGWRPAINSSSGKAALAAQEEGLEFFPTSPALHKGLSPTMSFPVL